ncbi:hypothetical protein BH10BAC4_BH10BAC4_14350 [soil metagenome]
MKRGFVLMIVLANICICTFGQDVPLFQSKDAIDLRINGSIKSIKKNSNDSTFVTAKLEYAKSPDQWIAVPAQVRVRGNYRLKNCFFPPLKLKFSKKEVASTLFEGNKALKLVIPCLTTSDNNSLVRKEYICYQLYQLVSPYYFRTRLANLELTEVSRKNPHVYNILSFFVEDNSMVAKRSQGKVIESKISPTAFDEKQAIRNDFFQYMIGNADWSAFRQHNSNTLYVDSKYVPLSYDFDMSGFVNAGYAHQNAPTLGTGNPRDRVYGGYCKSQSAMEDIRKEFLGKEQAIQASIDEYSVFFGKPDLKDMHGYLDQFFEILRNDHRFKNSILDLCKTQ